MNCLLLLLHRSYHPLLNGALFLFPLTIGTGFATSCNILGSSKTRGEHDLDDGNQPFEAVDVPFVWTTDAVSGESAV